MNRITLTTRWQAELARFAPGFKVYGPYRFGVWYVHRVKKEN